MNAIRQFLKNSPWAGWAFAGLILVAAIYIYMSRANSSNPYNPDRMREMVSIKFADTGEVIEMPRGRLDKEIRGRGDKIDPSVGIINPKTGQPTGFLFDSAEWTGMIDRINREKSQVREQAGGRTVTSVPRAPTAPSEQPQPGTVPPK